MSRRRRCSGLRLTRPTSRPAARLLCGRPEHSFRPRLRIFPLSWGFDNEVLLSTVYHSDWPAAEQITGTKGPRALPSGLDLAAALGSGYARSLLKTDIGR